MSARSGGLGRGGFLDIDSPSPSPESQPMADVSANARVGEIPLLDLSAVNGGDVKPVTERSSTPENQPNLEHPVKSEGVLPLPADRKRPSDLILIAPEVKRSRSLDFNSTITPSRPAPSFAGPSGAFSTLAGLFGNLPVSDPDLKCEDDDGDDDDRLWGERGAIRTPGIPLAPSEDMMKMIDSIPLEYRAPVGNRRLVRGSALQGTDESARTEAELIEEDRLRVKEAALRMRCKEKCVSLTRKEEIVADSMGEAVSTRVDNSPTPAPEASGAASLPNLVPGVMQGPVLDILDQDDEDMILRRPGEKANPTAPVRAPTVNTGINTGMEWIQGSQLGQRDADRKYKNVVEKILRWQVPGMRTPLLDHQVLGVDWMLAREYSSDEPRGGLVADVMGLGKTIQCIAAMALNTPPATILRKDPRVTLIVAPVALLRQWKEEITNHARHGFFDVHIHHGADKIQSLKVLMRKDVVITSYSTIMSSYPSPKRPKPGMSEEEVEEWWDGMWETRGIFHRMKFWRIILDEGHIIKNKRSRTSLACQNLKTVNSWILTGTPIQNSLDDLYPFFVTMGHPQLADWTRFSAIVDISNKQMAARKVQLLLRSCMMRRNKTDHIMGKPLIVLMEKRIRMVQLEFSRDERSLYECVETKSRETMNRYIEKGTVMKNYGSILAMLTRLRQLCNHPYLILQCVGDDFTVGDLELAIEGVPKVEGQDHLEVVKMDKHSSLRRILEVAKTQAIGDTAECYICQDVIDGAVMARCRHVFCRDCIEAKIINLGNSAPCPVCNRSIKEEDLSDYVPDDKPDHEDSEEWLDNISGDFMHSAKTLALRDQLLEWKENHPGDKIVLFSQFVKMLDIVQKVTEEENWNTVRYQGSMTLTDREEALSNFKHNSDIWIMLTSLRAGGVGLNLTHANLVLSLDLWWNAAVEAQAFDRVHRMGQEKEVYITRFVVKGTVEQRILELQMKKQRIADAALGDGEGLAMGRLGREELLSLFGEVVRDDFGRERLVRYDRDRVGSSRE